MNQEISGKSARGFASMDPAKQREIASKGGRKAHAIGTAHTFTKEEASAAGKKGGAKTSANRAFMAEIGRKGGRARGLNHTKKNTDLGDVDGQEE